MTEELEPISKRIPNRKHRAFIDALFLHNQNGTRAYQSVYNCSYDTARANAATLLADTSIRAEVERRLQENTLSANEVIARLSEHAKAEYSEYITDNGQIDIAQMRADGKAHLIQEIKDTKYGKVVKFPDSQSALVTVGKYHNLFNDNITVKLEQELSKTLDYLQTVLDSETFEKVLDAIAGGSEGSQTETSEPETE